MDYQIIDGRTLVDKLILYSVLALVGFVPLTISGQVMEIALFPKFLVLSGIVSLLSLLWLVKVIKYKFSPSFETPLTLPILFFILINIVSLKAAININASWFPLAQFLTLVMLFFIVTNNISVRDFEKIFSVLSFAVAVSAFIGIFQYFGWESDWTPSAAAPSGTMGHRNMAAMVKIMTIPLAGYLFIIEKKPLKILLFGLALVTMTVFLIYTRTRGAWVGLTGSLLVMATGMVLLPELRQTFSRQVLSSLKGRLKPAVLITGFFIIVGMSFLPSNTEDIRGSKSNVFSTASSILSEGGDSGRLGIWRSSLRMFKDNRHWITGVGLNNWFINYPYYAGGHLISETKIPYRPHNDFLWVLTETGITGFGIYLWLLITAAVVFVTIVRKSSGSRFALLGITIGLSLLAITGHSFFSFPRERITPSMLFWMNLAFLVIIYKAVQKPETGKKEPFSPAKVTEKTNPKYPGWVVVLFFLFLSIAATEFGRRVTLNEHYFKIGYNYYLREEIEASISVLKRADDILPDNWKTYYLFGLCQIDLENYYSSISWFNRCLAKHPFFPNAHYNLALANTKMENFVNALIHYRRAIELNPGFVKAHYNMGTVWHYIGNLDEAENEYLTAIDLDPDLSRAYNNLGVLYKQKKYFLKARENFQKALELDSTFQTARTNLDSVLYLIGD